VTAKLPRVPHHRSGLLLTGLLSLLPAAAFAATPPEGVAQEIRRGFFVSADMGVFFVPSGAQPNGYSDAQAYVQLEVGYDIIPQLSVNLSFGLGAVSNACYDGYNNDGTCGPNAMGGRSNGTSSENFTISYYQLTINYNYYRLFERLDLSVKGVVGYALAAPSPVAVSGSGQVLTQEGGFSPGIGLGAEYATNLDHFAIGLDVVGRIVVGPNIWTLAIFPRVKYTF
jgi:hypothetical protein